MTEMIHRSEIIPEQWVDTSFARFDGRQEFREKPQYGNRHAIFNPGSDWGEVEVDEYNAADFPNGTLNHLSKYTEEKTAIPQEIAKVGIVLGAGYVLYKLIKYFGENKFDRL